MLCFFVRLSNVENYPYSVLKMKKIIISLFSLILVACGGGGSDSGGMSEPTLPGTNVPESFVGVYSGTLNVSASALGLTETDSFPITVTVTNDAMVRFDGDSPEETFTVGIENGGVFRGTLNINEDECTGAVNVEGTVNGSVASGSLSGEGRCSLNGTNVSVTLSGDFSANR